MPWAVTISLRLSYTGRVRVPHYSSNLRLTLVLKVAMGAADQANAPQATTVDIKDGVHRGLGNQSPPLWIPLKRGVF